jgi:LmbE family N-acetylglucosaminyl deacetylase
MKHASSSIFRPSDRPLALDASSLPEGIAIAVMAPHPDDFDAIAVTLRRFQSRNAAIHLAVLTTGASGVEDGYDGATSNTAKGNLREAEQLASCARFGLPQDRIRFLRLPEDEAGLIVDAASIAAIRDWLLPIHADLVFMPHGNDSNVTHQRTYALFKRVVEEEGLSLWAVLNQDAKTRAMRHDLYTPFEQNEADWKSGLLRLHDTQHQRNLNTRGHGFDERVLAINRATAQTLNIAAPYAEAFELERWPLDKPTLLP